MSKSTRQDVRPPHYSIGQFFSICMRSDERFFILLSFPQNRKNNSRTGIADQAEASFAPVRVKKLIVDCTIRKHPETNRETPTGIDFLIGVLVSMKGYAPPIDRIGGAFLREVCGSLAPGLRGSRLPHLHLICPKHSKKRSSPKAPWGDRLFDILISPTGVSLTARTKISFDFKAYFPFFHLLRAFLLCFSPSFQQSAQNDPGGGMWPVRKSYPPTRVAAAPGQE